MSETPLTLTQNAIVKHCRELSELLIAKNRAYGDSALEPRGVFAKGDAVTLLCTRIDDKLSRIANKGFSSADEDTVQDLLGYLILLQIALERRAKELDDAMMERADVPHDFPRPYERREKA